MNTTCIGGAFREKEAGQLLKEINTRVKRRDSSPVRASMLDIIYLTLQVCVTLSKERAVRDNWLMDSTVGL